MRHAQTSPIAIVLAMMAVLVGACTGAGGVPPSTTTGPAPTTSTVPASTTEPPPTARGTVEELLSTVPPEARASDGGGDPRPSGYWAVWNTCAPDNRAAEAEANGGRAAGWVLVDDVLADPGIGLGDHLLTSCEESVALLEGRTGTGEETTDPAYALAGQLLAAELNLTVGAEACPVAEEAAFGAHLLLSTANFDGVSTSPLHAEAGGAVPRLVDLLTTYNSGELCR